MRTEGGSRWRDDVSLIRELLALVKPVHPLLLRSILAGVFGHLCAIALMAVGAAALVAALSTGVLSGWFIGALLGLAVTRGLLHYIEQYAGHDIAFRSLALLREQAFASVRAVAPARVSGMPTGELASRVMDDVEVVEVFFAHTIVPVTIAAVVDSVVLISVAVVSPATAAVMLGLYVLVLVIPRLLGRRTRGVGATYRTLRGKSQAQVVDAVRGVRDLVLLGADERVRNDVRDSGRQLDALQRRAAMRSSIAGVVGAICVAVAPVLALLTSWGLGAGAIVLAAIAASSFGPTLAVGRLTMTLDGVLSAARRICELRRLTPRVTDRDARQDPVSWHEDIHVDDVVYRYPGSRTPVLDHCCLAVRAGRITHIDAPSGAGKTTVLDLLLRFDDPESGAIRIGTRELTSIPLSELRAHIVLVEQETFLFTESVAENVRIGRAGATLDEVWSALEAVQAAEFVRSLPEGIDTVIGPGGHGLSGGQRQRIGLARAYLSRAPIVVLDEPTSNLDAQTESHILDTVTRTFAGRTVIITSHRQRIREWADDVAVLVPRPHELSRSS